MQSFFETLSTALTGPDAPARQRRRAQRLLAIAAMVAMITLLGPLFGYGLMACAGVAVMLSALPAKEVH